MQKQNRTYKPNGVIIIFTWFFLILGCTVSASERASFNEKDALTLLQHFNSAYPQQKAYLHTDKTSYLAGETIWLKAYLVDAKTHQPDTLSTNLYVELISQGGDLLSLLLLRLREGTAHGDIAIPDSLPEGNYRFRVYTDWMKNFDSGFFFTKDIFIHNREQANYIRRSELRKNRRFNRDLEETKQQYQFAFFPEGGNLVSGFENRVAFKAADGLGNGIDVKGVLFDRGGNRIAAFESVHNGLGMIAFTPEKEMQYQAEIQFPNGEVKSFKLPGSRKDTYLLSATNKEDRIHVRVKSKKPGTNNDLFLFAHTRGKHVHSEKVHLQNGSFETMILTGTIPEGICHITLFTQDGTPVAERLVFINRHSFENIQLLEKTTSSENEEYISVRLKLDQMEWGPSGNYSLVLLDQPDAVLESGTNIAAGFLLSEDLKTVKDPWFYLDPNNSKAMEAADLLMMTHGWRRFEWDQLLSNDLPELKYGFPQGVSISGQVTPRSSARETGEVKVDLVVEQEGTNMFSTTTDKKGNFIFRELKYDGAFKALLRVIQGVEKRSLYLELTPDEFNIEGYAKNFNTHPLSITERGDNWERTRRPDTPLSARRSFAPSARPATMYGDVDQVIYFDDIRNQYHRVVDVLETRVRGLSIEGGRILLRGPSSLFFNNEPLFLVDEQVVTRGQFLNTNIQEIDRLTVISGPQSAIFGSRGSNGALLIYTRRGDRHAYESFEYLLQGFHQPTETFESKIFTASHETLGVSRTLIWKPEVVFDETGHTNLQLPMNDSGRTAMLYVEGINAKGEISFFALPIMFPEEKP